MRQAISQSTKLWPSLERLGKSGVDGVAKEGGKQLPMQQCKVVKGSFLKFVFVFVSVAGAEERIGSTC